MASSSSTTSTSPLLDIPGLRLVGEIGDRARHRLEVERLREEGIGALGEDGLPLLGAVETGHRDDEWLAEDGVLLYAPTQGVAVDAGEVDIEDDEARSLLGQEP